MSDPVIGMTFEMSEDDVSSVAGADHSRALLIETSEDASDIEIPLNTPVRASTGDANFRAALGSGPLYDAIFGIRRQVGGLNAEADVTVVRVKEEATPAATCANIAAILDAVAEIPPKVNATPRLVWAGRTDWRPDGLTKNPVITALEPALETLLAVAPVDLDGTTRDLAIDARETIDSERILPIGIASRDWHGDQLVTVPTGPRAVGLFIAEDKRHGGKPFDPICNRSMNIAGVSRDIGFSLLSGANEGQQLLDAEIAIIDQGETEVDGASADGGFIFWGVDSATNDEVWKQIHQVRGSDYLKVKMMKITRRQLGRRGKPRTMQVFLHSQKKMLEAHKKAEDILGFEMRFDPDHNAPEDIALGHFDVSFNIEYTPSIKKVNHRIGRYRPALKGYVRDLMSSMNSALY
ncbi:phage tail protein [Roseibium sediminis]|uniref:phage tail protein n=1 Tax=Roseibium sediminis TaxID=1775174 RepID=UPI00123CA29F|nr:phage tail protein [Roseibium sediminis]